MTKDVESSQKEKGLPKGAIYILGIALVITAILSITVFVPNSPPSNAIFNVTLRYYTTGVEKSYYGDYASIISTNMREIGVDVNLVGMEYATFLGTVVSNKDFDLAILEIDGLASPHLEVLFKENASLNVFNYLDDYDDGYLSEKLLEAEQELDSSLRQSLYFEIQDHIMENLVPMVPLLTPANTFAFWNNLIGFSPELGISNSLPYMEFQGLHENQETEDELKMGVGYWYDLNPLTITRPSAKIILSLMMDELFKIDSDGDILPGGLIKGWKYLNNTHMLLRVRDDVYWQPDVDNTYTSEQFSVDDLMFTINTLRSPYTNNEFEIFDWIEGMKKYNSSTIELFIDSNPLTTTNEAYAYVLEDLSVYPLPNYYLNVSSSLEDIVSSARWEKYSANPFGTGKYKLDFEELEPSVTAILTRFNNWHGVGVLPNENTNLAFDSIYVNTYRDLYTMTLGLQNGELDFASFGKNPRVIDDITKSDILIKTASYNSLVFLAINLNHPIMGGENNFANTTQEGVSKALAVRKAISHVINKVQLNSAFHNNRYNITDSPVSTYYSNYYYTGVTRYDYSIAQAVEYIKLADIGAYQNTGNTNTNNAPFSFLSSLIALPICSILIFKYIRRNKNRGQKS